MLFTGMISPTSRLPNALRRSLTISSIASTSSWSASGTQTHDCQLRAEVSGASARISSGSGT